MADQLTPRSENFAEWYNQIVQKADLADYGAAKGTMIIKPYGYALWENIQAYLDKRFKLHGAKNPSRTFNAKKNTSKVLRPISGWSHRAAARNWKNRMRCVPHRKPPST